MRTGCRCPPMSVRRSPRTCARGRPRATGGRCSCRPGLRMRRSRRGRSPRRCVARADGPGIRGRLAPAAAHDGVRDGPARGAARADRAGAAAPQPAEHRDLRARGPRPAAATRRAVARRCAAMSALREHVEDYLRLRRALGFKLERHGRLLPQLVAYLEAAGASTITSELAISWARLPAHAQPNHWAAGWRSRAGSPPTCRRSTRRRRSRRPACSRSATSARPRTCGRGATSAGCSRPRGAASSR